MKKILNSTLKLIFGDTALYFYFGFSVLGILSLSAFQMHQKIEEAQAEAALIPIGVEPDFRPYVLNFVKESQKYILPSQFRERINHLTVKYGFPSRLNDEHDFVGWCELNTTTVIVEKDTWNTYAEGSKQNLIDHELGHCLLERNHRPFMGEGNNPVSIMFPSVLPSEYYAKNKSRLYPELFDISRSNRIRIENQLFNTTWNLERQELFKTVPEYLRFIEAQMNGDEYQPWPLKPKPQVVQFDTADIIIAHPNKNSRQDK